MAVPKRRSSSTRRDRRRSHLALDKVNVVNCPNCGASRLPHRVCPACGYYDGVQVVKPVEKTLEKE